MLAIVQINERALGGLTILDLNGKLTIDNGAQLIKDKCESLAFQRRTQVIVNLAAVPYIDSGGLGQLVACYTSLGKAGGRLTLANINKTNHDLLRAPTYKRDLKSHMAVSRCGQGTFVDS